MSFETNRLGRLGGKFLLLTIENLPPAFYQGKVVASKPEVSVMTHHPESNDHHKNATLGKEHDDVCKRIWTETGQKRPKGLKILRKEY